MLKLIELTKKYNRSRVLNGVSLCCAQGEALCLAGANAAGKTTILRIAAGLLSPDSGRVETDGRLRFIPQENELLEDLTVGENIHLWRLTLPNAARPFAPNSPELVLGLEPIRKKRILALSGGMKKRVAIACALAGDPDLLLMDEPFAALDIGSRGEVCALLEQLRQQGKGILFSSHDPDAIARTACRVAGLSGGRITVEEKLEGTREERLIKAIKLLEDLGQNVDSME